MTFTFTGTGIEWFGNQDKRHGIAKVYMDGQLVQQIDSWSTVSRKQQRIFWSFNLPQGKHTLKIVNTGKKTKGSKGTFMDVDALVVTQGPKTPPAIATTQDFQMSPQELGYPPLFDFASQSTPALQWTLRQNGSTGVHARCNLRLSPSHML
ncbi:hypothetical protein A0H81_10739 [Grifola frondosa]|uniref:Uncharacterized protein n=1 Tax=Grifola frondosa TaxID=5627 RepID=A0A1C7LX54_GRIFR|nr:hypothetical protein A0H81_10739 [Grifola frondosa]